VAESVVFATLVLAGVAIGSFLNVVIHRGPSLWGLVDDATPRGGLTGPRSYCTTCRAPVAPRHLTPLVSYIALKGKCAACGAAISARYPIVELLGGLVVIIAVTSFGLTGAALAAALFGFALVALAAIDLETGFLPDAITLPLVGAGVAANLFSAFVAPVDAAIGALAGFGSLWAIGAVYEKLRGREGLGLGDAKLFAAIGAWTGWTMLPVILFTAAISTLAAIGARTLLGRKSALDEAVPFGPGLCVAGFAGLLLAGFGPTAL
jgi:leader peptidase (prepilin peptidase)/N-methyltransferase